MHKKSLTYIILIFVVSLVSLFYFYRVPSSFPEHYIFTISPGESLQSITADLYAKHIIQSETVFRSLVILFGGEKKVIAGNYLLSDSQGTLPLAYRFAHGKFGIDFVKITIPEGWTVSQIADYLDKNLIDFDTANFVRIAKKEEGFLFPDTYYLFPMTDSLTVMQKMEDNFTKRLEPLHDTVVASPHSIFEIITMASILEGEALPKDRPTVSGILWKRISMGMPLQVDSTLKYITGKPSSDLTVNDLKINSPYNTYKYKGLPPAPINNPGMDAILAALNPVKTDYLYFLTEKDGTIHYAKTFEEHTKNIAKYLK